MIVVMEPDARSEQIESVAGFLEHAGFSVQRSQGETHSLIGVLGDVSSDDVAVVEEFEGVAEVVRVSEPFRLASRRFRSSPSIVEGAWGRVGGERPWIAIEPIGLEASPRPAGASVPPAEFRYEIAAGRPFDAAVLRGRFAPDSVGALTCLSMHPHPSEMRWPVAFVARQPSWGANHWIGAAERVLERRDCQVVMLEAGGEYPNGARTLEIAAIARAKQRTHLPLVVDVPSIAQRAKYTAAVACAAIGGGADGVVLRVWVGPDGGHPRLPATLRWREAVVLADTLRKVGAAVRG